MVVLLALVALAAFWFHLLPRHPLTDLGFVAFMAAPILFHWFRPVYPDPAPRLPGETLAHLMWIHVGLATILNVRRIDPDFGFWPSARHWRVGLVWFGAALPPLLALAYLTGFAQLALPAVWFKYAAACATFFGILWMVALSEEFFFRALLQEWIGAWAGSALAGLVCAALLFGAAHLGYRNFPNWRMALLACVLGAACGMAYRQAGLRAAMVTHALLVTVWRTFLR